jgi:mRNA interferase YafQ
MYKVHRSTSFCKGFKKIKSSIGGPKILLELSTVIDTLVSGSKLLPKYRDHGLKGEYLGYRECHIRGDVLLVYQIQKENMILALIEIGSHSYLF